MNVVIKLFGSKVQPDIFAIDKFTGQPSKVTATTRDTDFFNQMYSLSEEGCSLIATDAFYQEIANGDFKRRIYWNRKENERLFGFNLTV